MYFFYLTPAAAAHRQIAWAFAVFSPAVMAQRLAFLKAKIKMYKYDSPDRVPDCLVAGLGHILNDFYKIFSSL